MSDDKAVTLTVLSKTVWSPNLFSFTTTRPKGFRFEAGQFVRLGLCADELIYYQDKHQDTPKSESVSPIFRAYSVVSSPYDETLEFFRWWWLMGSLHHSFNTYKQVISCILIQYRLGFDAITLPRTNAKNIMVIS